MLRRQQGARSGHGFRMTRARRWALLLALIGAAGPVVAVLFGKALDASLTDDPPKPQSCPPFPHLTPGEVIPGSGNNQKLKSVRYKTSFTPKSRFVHLEMSGQVTPLSNKKHQLIFFIWTDPNTYDEGQREGNDLYSWKKTQKMSADKNGCWKVEPFKLGYAGARGLTFHFHAALLPTSQESCIDVLFQEDEKRDKQNGKDDGYADLSFEQLTDCGIVLLGNVKVPTKHL